tara:strand:- start:1482 stop:1616 length:135 start_codon:yes stop_codon:yes gene_type:complete
MCNQDIAINQRIYWCVDCLFIWMFFSNILLVDAFWVVLKTNQFL